MNVLQLANIPGGFQQICRSTTHVAPAQKPLAAFLFDQIDRLPESLRGSTGATLLGPSLSGKTHWGCAWLKAILASGAVQVGENYCDPRRFDYLELISQKEDFSTHQSMIHNLRGARAVFLDNITLRPPTPAVLSALWARRDEGRLTWLAFNALSVNEVPEGLAAVFSSFQRRNRAFFLPEFVPPSP